MANSKTVALGTLILFVGWSALCQRSAAQIAGGNLPVGTASAAATSQLLATASVCDADLNDIEVISADRLCAVGNSGTILLSLNAGREWRAVTCPIPGNLHAVEFLDSQVGVAVGGSIGPYSKQSSAAIIVTRDGGESWHAIENSLPRLVGMTLAGNRFVAWGDYGHSNKNSMYISQDAGNSWHSASIPLAHVQAAAVANDGSIAAVARDGQSIVGLPGSLQPWSAPDTTQSIAWTGDRWLVCGDQGMLATSSSTGWHLPDLPLSNGSLQHCHWTTIHTFGQEIWIAGSPGSILLHSADSGRTWRFHHTDQTLPLRSIGFVDAMRGWAVGSLGTILATRDGGQSWYPQRQSSKRSGVLSLTDERKIPWTPLAAAAWDAGVSVTSLVAPDTGSGSGTPASDKTTLPVLDRHVASGPLLGVGVHRWRLAASDAATNPNIQLQVDLATWRPDVLLIAETDGAQDQNLNNLIQQSMHIDHGHLSSELGNVLDELGLKPWKPLKLVSVESEVAQYTEQSNRVVNALGMAIWDILLALPPEEVLRSESASMQTVWSKVANRASTSSLLGSVPPSVTTRRELVLPKVGSLQLLMGRVHRTRAISRLAEETDDLQRWKEDLGFVLTHFPAHEIAPHFWQLASALQAQSDQPRRRLVLETLARLPGDASYWAARTLLLELASDEMSAWQSSDLMATSVKPLSAATDNAGSVPTLNINDENTRQQPWNASPFAESETPTVVAASAEVASHQPTQESVSVEAWFEQLNLFSQLHPELIHTPSIQLAAYRMSAQHGRRQGDLGHLNLVRAAPAWSIWPSIANQETRLWHNEVESLPRVALAANTYVRPRLNGSLDEPLWHRVPPMQLAGTDSRDALAGAATIRWAYDRKYLYLGLHCPTPVPTTPPVQRIRQYDSELSDIDHVIISIDTNRDYHSRIELAVAQDGRTFDRCMNRKEFNPKWHVFVAPAENGWTAEIAVELQYLTTNERLTGDAWVVSAGRQQPDTAGKSRVTHHWSRPGMPPLQAEAGGLMLFLPEDATAQGAAIGTPPMTAQEVQPVAPTNVTPNLTNRASSIPAPADINR